MSATAATIKSWPLFAENGRVLWQIEAPNWTEHGATIITIAVLAALLLAIMRVIRRARMQTTSAIELTQNTIELTRETLQAQRETNRLLSELNDLLRKQTNLSQTVR